MSPKSGSSSNKNLSYSEIEKKLVTAAKSYFKDHPSYLPTSSEEAVEVEREYFDMECPICKEHKEVDANEHIELFGSNEFKNKAEPSDIDLIDPFGTVEVPDIDSQNPFETFKSIGPKPCSICGKMFCEHRYPFR